MTGAEAWRPLAFFFVFLATIQRGKTSLVLAMPAPAAQQPSPLKRRLRSFGRAFLDIFYPRSCRVCEEPLPGERGSDPLSEWLCGKCAGELLFIEPPYCKVCGEHYDGAITTEFRCMNCADRKFAFEFAIASCKADGHVRSLIHAFKYGSDLSLRGLLSRLLLRALDEPRLASEQLADWLLVPVPLYRARETDREYNQSRELCRGLTRLTGIATVDCLKRLRPTTAQASMSRQQRLQNLKGAFAMKRWLGGPHRARDASILLVDDVLTTGATTHECAKVLKKEGGAARVVAITLARG